MDAVYIFRSESIKNNELLRYSIRSLEINMPDLENVYIVGDYPGFLKYARNLPCKDVHEKKWQNAFAKTLIACGESDLSDEFILMNDDFYLNEAFMSEDLPFWAVKGGNGGSSGLTDYRIHAPVRIKKEMYLKLPIDINEKADISPRTFYCNFYGAPPTYIEDCIIKVGHQKLSYDDQVYNKPFFSVGDDGAENAKFMNWLRKKYPETSKYEN